MTEEMILKEIKEIENEIKTDYQRSFGNVPEDAYESQYQRIYDLEEELARMNGFNSYIEYIVATVMPQGELPF